jgi:ribosome biogenesis SPOUT family RNA methylase Rps3
MFKWAQKELCQLKERFGKKGIIRNAEGEMRELLEVIRSKDIQNY